MKNKIKLILLNELKKKYMWIVYIISMLLSNCYCKTSDRPHLQYFMFSQSKDFFYTVEGIERTYCVRIFDGDGIVYIDPEKYRTRDVLYITWDENKDILWLYSSDIGTYCIFFENGEWVKKHYKECDFDLPLIFHRFVGHS